MPLALALWLVIVIVYDFRKRRVPNWLVLSGALLAVAAMVTGTHPVAISSPDALAAGALAFLVMLVFYAAGLMGAGDVKFAGALGLWIGMQGLLPVWIISSLLAAAHSIVWTGLDQRGIAPRLFAALSAPPRTAPGSKADPVTEHVGHQPPRRQRHIPYAAYLAVAALIWMTSPLEPLLR